MYNKMIYLVSFVLVLDQVVVASGSEGLLGHYYYTSGEGPPANPWKTLVLTRIDPTVNFNWGTESPDPSINANDFAVRWTGTIEAPASDVYTFHTQTDDGIRLWVNNQLIIENWTEHGNTHDSGDIALTAGQKYEIILEWYENGVYARCELSWSTPTRIRETIPSQYLSVEMLYARNPNPADGAIHSDTWASLGWMAGDTAASHDVYFGDNFDDVDAGAEGTFLGNQPGTFLIFGFPGFAYPDGPILGTTYYWRIDEVEADGTTIHKGDIWSFTVPPRTAYEPYPPEGAKYVDPNVELIWSPGFGEKLHTVHFGDNFDDVNNAAGGLPQATTTYTPGPLELDKVYYWRIDDIDEFNGVVSHKGNVWSFRTKPEISITNPNLIGWWKLNKGHGTTALDWSGHGRDGVFRRDPQWVAGKIGGALEFDGVDDYVDCGNDAVFDITGEITVAAWIKVEAFDRLWQAIVTKGDSAWRLHRDAVQRGVGFHCSIQNGRLMEANGITSLDDGEWHHVVGVYDGIRGYLYVDGLEDAVSAKRGAISTNTFNVCIGENAEATGRYWDGLIDDVRIYKRALTEAEIQVAMQGVEGYPYALSPIPDDGALHQDMWVSLAWSPGDYATSHQVYFGTDEEAVRNANTGSPEYKGSQVLGSESYDPGKLEWDTTYYWRVDEVEADGTIWKGNVWSFTTINFLIVDDFEDYDVGDNQIWYTWKDGLGYGTPGTEPYYAGNRTGSAVGGETIWSGPQETIVYGGNQSMQYIYDNNKRGYFKYSEAELTLTYPRDWTEKGVNTLTIWFRGNSDNAPEAMYVALDGSAIVTHDNPNAAQIDTWTEWNIDLSAPGGFADQGVNLANVNTIALGLGKKNNPQAGGSGTMYFDDIRLYPPPEPAP